MPLQLLTFKRIKHEDQLNDLLGILQTHDITYEVEKVTPTYNAVFGSVVNDKEFIVKIPPDDFIRVENMLLESAKENLNQIDKSYYLFEFSDEELFEILLKPDEWSPFDFELATKFLSERGKAITPEVLDLMKKSRIHELTKPEPSLKTWIFAGYLFAFVGGMLGILMGWHLMSHKKTLPNGTRVFAHNESDRKHGQIVFIIGAIFFVITIFLKNYLFIETDSIIW